MKLEVGQEVQVRLDAPGPGGPALDTPAGRERYNRNFTRVVEGTVVKVDPLLINLIVTEDNFDDWEFLMPDQENLSVGDSWLADWIEEDWIVEVGPKLEERFPMSDWRYEVANGDTRLGYEDWLEHKVEAEA